MTRPIGEIFEYNGVKLKVVKSKNCKRCYWQHKGCYYAEELRIRGLCSKRNRDDFAVKFVKVHVLHRDAQTKKSIYFKEIKE